MTKDRVTAELIEEDRYELQVGPTYQFSPNRREFVVVAGAGIMISVSSIRAAGQQPRGPAGRSSQGRASTRISERIHIAENGIVTVYTGKVEVGQGAKTQVCQAVAEELDVPLEQIRAVMGDTDLCPNDGGTFGSRTTPSTIPQIRSAVATAREALLDIASKKLQLPREEIELRQGEFIHVNSGAKTDLSELAQDRALLAKFEGSADTAAEVRAVGDWQILGTSPKAVDAVAVVTGARQYPSDIRPPGMLYGKVLRPPALGATLESIDLDPAKAIKGVVAVQDDQFVGCAAPSSHLAQQAVIEISKTAQWKLADPATQTSSVELFDYLKEHASPPSDDRRGGGRRPRGGITTRGSVEDGLAASQKALNATFDIAYIQHAPMEPRAAVAQWKDGKLTVWTGTQNPTRVRGELMQAFRLSADRARVIVPDTGGGFGGKHTGEVALEAARLARAAGRPVSVRWTREEEFTWAYFRPAGRIETKGGLDASGKIVAWEFNNYNSGGSALATPYEIPNVQCQSIRCDAPLRSGSYRALAATANTFGRECFMDELAGAAGADPLQFRLDHLAPGRLRNVLEAAAKRFRWTERRRAASPREGVGIACGTEKGSFVAACAAVHVETDGTIKVDEVCQAYECGAIHNPANLLAQVEGCLIMGLGGALREEIHFSAGKVLNGRFSDYLVPRMDDLPKLDIVLLNRSDLPSVGAGETPIIAVAPAIAGAICQATAVRVRSMPVRTEGLRAS